MILNAAHVPVGWPRPLVFATKREAQTRQQTLACPDLFTLVETDRPATVGAKKLKGKLPR